MDVSSISLEARIGRQGAAASFPNNPEGIAALAAFCLAHEVELVAMEATGGYEQQAFAQLSEQGLGGSHPQPARGAPVRPEHGSLEKTDAIDAGMIAWYRRSEELAAGRAWPRPASSICAPWSPACASSPTSAPRSAISSGWSPTRRCRLRSPNCWR